MIELRKLMLRRDGRGIALLAALTVLLPLLAEALDFTSKLVSDPAKNSREPAIGETGLIAWIAHGTNTPDDERSDVEVWDGTELKTLTEAGSDSGFGSHRPVVQSNTVVWISYFSQPGKDVSWILKEVPTRDEGAPELPARYVATQIGSEQILIPVTNLQEGVTNKAEEVRRHPSGLSEIVRWDKGGEVKRITIDYRNDFAPSSWGSLISWQVAKGFPFGWEIMAWDNNEFIQLTTNFYYDMAPKVQGRQICWYGWDGHDFEIFLFDREKNLTTQITSNQYDDVSPVIWGGQLAWEGYPTAESDVYIWRAGETKKLSDNIEDDFNPRIWNGQVAWQGFDGDDFEIYFFDGEKLPFKLTNNSYDDTNPEIGARFIVWTGFHDNWDAEIFAMDKTVGAKSGQESRITENEEEDRNPRTAGNRIVWQGEREGRVGIYLAEPK